MSHSRGERGAEFVRLALPLATHISFLPQTLAHHLHKRFTHAATRQKSCGWLHGMRHMTISANGLNPHHGWICGKKGISVGISNHLNHIKINRLRLLPC